MVAAAMAILMKRLEAGGFNVYTHIDGSRDLLANLGGTEHNLFLCQHPMTTVSHDSPTRS